MQVVLGAFLALRAWQLRRLDTAEVASGHGGAVASGACGGVRGVGKGRG
jgi:hypothetical protein